MSTNSTTRALRNRPSGTYYARVKVNGKQKWRALDTTMFTMAKLRQADVKKTICAQAMAAAGGEVADDATRNRGLTSLTSLFCLVQRNYSYGCGNGICRSRTMPSRSPNVISAVTSAPLLVAGS